MVLSLLMAGIFIAFLIVSRRYKLRMRSDVIPYHMFAENQFESNYMNKTENGAENTNTPIDSPDEVQYAINTYL